MAREGGGLTVSPAWVALLPDADCRGAMYGDLVDSLIDQPHVAGRPGAIAAANAGHRSSFGAGWGAEWAVPRGAGPRNGLVASIVGMA